MAKIKFFNAFVLKKNVNGQTQDPPKAADRMPVFTGLPNNPSQYPTFQRSTSNATGRAETDINVINKKDWIIEEARIKGGFNEKEVGYGTRAYLVEDSGEQQRRFNALIYSGIYNSNTGINETNVFSVGEEITKAVDPKHGSIQKLHALDTNLAILQENKISRALIDKDAIYSAEGAGAVTSTNLVIGQITPYVGEYGISKNPESFAVFGYRRYFTDKYRSSVMRLSNDGLTEISQYGMSDFFRDELDKINDGFKNFTFKLDYVNNSASNVQPFKISVSGTSSYISFLEKGCLVSIPQLSGSVICTVVAITGTSTTRTLYLSNSPVSPINNSEVTITKYIKDRIIGGYDNYNKNYVLSLQDKSDKPDVSDKYKTLSFEDVPLNGWVSFYTYEPKFVASSKGKYYSFYGSEVYEHYSNNNRNTFYGVSSNSNIEFIFNANPSIVKNFKTVNYEGSNGWQVESFLSDSEGFDIQQGTQQQFSDSANSIKSYNEGVYVDGGVEYRVGFNRKENKYFANLVNNSAARPGEVLFGNTTTGIKGYFTTVKLSTDATTDVGGSKELFAVSTEFVVSSR